VAGEMNESAGDVGIACQECDPETWVLVQLDPNAEDSFTLAELTGASVPPATSPRIVQGMNIVHLVRCGCRTGMIVKNAGVLYVVEHFIRQLVDTVRGFGQASTSCPAGGAPAHAPRL
jgi:hypothetical protein